MLRSSMSRRRAGGIAAASVAAVIGLAAASHAQSGSLDTTFGGTGFVTTTYGAVNDVVVQPSTNKIVAGGYERLANGTGNGWAILRYNTDGTLDTTFGTGGKVILFPGNTTAKVLDVALDSSERILASGYAFLGSNAAFTVVRLNAADGSLDTSFGSGGIVQTRISTGSKSDWSTSVAVDPTTGKIVVGGGTPGKKSMQVGLVRYTTSGALDTSFDGDGIRIDDWTAEEDTIVRAGLAIQNDSKIIALRDKFAAIPNDWRVARYNSNGSNDSTFGSSGKINPTFSGQTNTRTWGIAIQSDGRLVVSGRCRTTSSGTYQMLVSRHNTDGTFDTLFDSDGWIVTTGSVEKQSQRCAIQSDGKIVVATHQVNGADVSDVLVARFNTNGSLDTSFDGDGFSQFGGTTNTDFAFGIALDGNGRIVVGGPCEGAMGNLYLVGRYLQ